MFRMALASVCLAALGQAALAANATMPLDAAVQAFGALEMVEDIGLSPDGSRAAIIMPSAGRGNALRIIDLASGRGHTAGVADGSPLRLSSCDWASNERLVCTQYGITDAITASLVPFTRMVAMNADGSNLRSLAQEERSERSRIRQFDGSVIDWLGSENGTILMARHYVPLAATMGQVGSSLEGLGVDRLDTATGKFRRIEPPRPDVEWYLSDGAGNVRFKASNGTNDISRELRGITNIFYKPTGRDEWQPFGTFRGGQGLWPLAIDGKQDVVYALKKTAGRDALYRVALDGSMKEELIYQDPRVDVDGVVLLGRQQRVIGARYEVDKPETIYFDPQYKALSESLSKALPGRPLVRVVSSSNDESKLLILAFSDVDPGRYYLFDRKTKSLNELLLSRPKLENVKLGEVRAVRYKAADGTEIPAYLTLPPGSDGKGLPAIVMPHGGPASRDSWGFDWLPQFFVSQGYAVLQPNYRGSSGFGDEWFAENGWKSWKLAIGDVNAGGKWLIDQGIAAPGKLAIVGWSYGGYAALQANVLDPDLFKAAIAIAPVTDLDTLKYENLTFTSSRVVANYIGTGPHVAEGSPARHADQFKAPVLMFHGTSDLNVGVGQARTMDSRLRGAGKRSTLVIYPNLDHQLTDAAARTDMLAKSAAFLAENLGR
jgi:acetyl esterase/lipase